MITALTPYKSLLIVVSYAGAVLAGMFLMHQWDRVDTLEDYKQQVQQTAVIQAKLEKCSNNTDALIRWQTWYKEQNNGKEILSK